MAPQSELLRLAEEVCSNTYEIVKHLRRHHQEEPTFDPGSADIDPYGESRHYQALRASINDAANDLLLLVNGPKSVHRTFLTATYELAAYQIALEYKYFENVPLEGDIHVSKLAEIVGMDVDRTGRVLRMLAALRIFEEVAEDRFAHSAVSAVLAIDENLNYAACMQ
ncbi:MAG: hypothetical protein Q9163_000501 [Psora crenata]